MLSLPLILFPFALDYETRDVLIKATMTMIPHYDHEHTIHAAKISSEHGKELLVVLHGALLVFLVHGT